MEISLEMAGIKFDLLLVFVLCPKPTYYKLPLYSVSLFWII